MRRPPSVNFTNILWATFVPKSFPQKITNPNCKHLRAVQRALVWLSISPTFYKQLFHTKVLCVPFMCLQLGFVFFWRKDFGPKTAHKLLVKLTPTFLLEEQLQYLRQDIQNDQINCDNQQNIFYYFSDCIFADRLYKLAHLTLV